MGFRSQLETVGIPSVNHHVGAAARASEMKGIYSAVPAEHLLAFVKSSGCHLLTLRRPTRMPVINDEWMLVFRCPLSMRIIGRQIIMPVTNVIRVVCWPK